MTYLFEDQRRRTQRGPIASCVTYVAYNMHTRHLHNLMAIMESELGDGLRSLDTGHAPDAQEAPPEFSEPLEQAPSACMLTSIALHYPGLTDMS
jgi:hypothetical protein